MDTVVYARMAMKAQFVKRVRNWFMKNIDNICLYLCISYMNEYMYSRDEKNYSPYMRKRIFLHKASHKTNIDIWQMYSHLKLIAIILPLTDEFKLGWK